MLDKIDFNKFKGKVIDHVEVSTNWIETQYISLTIYFTNGESIDIGADGEEGYLSIT